MARNALRDVPPHVYRLHTGAALVAGMEGRAPLKLYDWARANPSPHAHPDFMINVAGMPVERATYNRRWNAFENIGEENQKELLAIFDRANGASDKESFIRDCLHEPENIGLLMALSREGMLDDESYLDHEFEYLVLHKKFPDFFDMHPAKNPNAAHSRTPRYTSRAGEIFKRVVMNGHSVLSPEQCSPWAVLAAAGVIPPVNDRDDATPPRFDI